MNSCPMMTASEPVGPMLSSRTPPPSIVLRGFPCSSMIGICRADPVFRSKNAKVVCGYVAFLFHDVAPSRTTRSFP